ncbi:enoyl-CoA hydratase/isomerase [Phenylobacterium zucineum HLK1]|uniref:Enoyl-CoA hydratase/isomerase n=1 Tax=Phenylobacterium zucineum (strain HLK1) TaxID=450851 RepID=B4RH15_PHEZH|nr:enoyl-CoA hydratase-related protein [Phenylobacterium zucineum]ACG78963.1 enoyl-CoA hydratase/isomerase [Phenylobacterium zucineum HLK1]
MNDFVQCEISEGVAVVTLNRPERLNAIGPAMGDLFDRTMVQVGLDDAVKVVVLTGSGRGFCAGADMERLDDLAATAGGSFERLPPGSPHPVFDALADSPPEHRSRYIIPSALPKPVIAAVNGACAGVGLSLAASCDVRFASTDALFTAGFPRRGLTAEAGLAFTLPAIVGQGAAADILLSGRRLSAHEALRIGLVSVVLEPADLLAHAVDYARDIAENVSPRSTRVIKRQLWKARSETFAEALTTAYEEVVASLESEDFKEGVAHFRERRKPVFVGR